ncbi:MAG: trypsin-like peptidase domain-containing protein [Chloroflexi bacterium]|nr:trypsin-like peptidase domain-containing protein [Chloroflexota bacterium]
MQTSILEDSHIACPFQVLMLDSQGVIGLGTAFFYEHAAENFIITNWHNVVGKHPYTGEALHDERSPSLMAAKWPSLEGIEDLGDGLLRTHFQAQPISIEDEGQPLWFEHPEFGSVCDVVAIPFQKPDNWPPVTHKAANKIEEGSIPIRPGTSVAVIGFPLGLSTGPGLPLFKTGCLSSIPGFEIRLGGEFSPVGGLKSGIRTPALLLDVHTLPGMSGSPVFAEHSGLWNPADPLASGITGNSVIGTGRMFLGCHSSRVLGLEDRSGLGLCFGEDVIKEICQARFPGSRCVGISSESA